MASARGHILALAMGLALIAARPAWSEDIDVAQYGNSTSGFPYAVALAKGFFKDSGADVTGIIGTVGGGTDVRNLVAGGLLYADVALPAAIAAIQQGADIVIVSESAENANSLVWVTKPGSPIKSVKDLKGKRLGYSTPQSFTQAAASLMLARAGYSAGDVTLVATGGFGPGLTELGLGGVDITISPLPDLFLHPDKYIPVIWGRDVLPPLANTVGIALRSTARQRPAVITAIIEARRRAVEYMAAHRAESAEIIAKPYKTDPALIEKIMTLLIDQGKVDGIPYWGDGSFDYPGMNNMIKAGLSVGMLQGNIDINSMMTEDYLPPDLRSKKP